MQKTVESATKKLWEAVEAQRSNPEGVSQLGMILPPSFLRGLRKALEAGLTCEELVSFMLILTGIREMKHDYDGDELMIRTAYLVDSMKGDIDYIKGQQELENRRIKIRDAGRKSRKSSRIGVVSIDNFSYNTIDCKLTFV